jgi:mRNA interferase RelE/StbE
MYRVRVERKAQKMLSKIPEPYYSNLKTAILDLGNNPRPQGYKKLKGRDGYRIRVADYRIIYEIQDSILLVDVVDLGHRKDIYE